MKPTLTDSTRALGLDVALICARYLCQTDHLHYGYWPDDLPVNINNLKTAQENYVRLLMEHIPAGTRTILDVGMGTGVLAGHLRDHGYEVECVSPAPYLTERARVLLGSEHVIHECKYEDIETTKRYDLVLFSESFQYINLPQCLAVTDKVVAPGGHILICDFFRRDTPEKGPFGGGHQYADFCTQVGAYPWENRVNRDITKETAPNLDMVSDAVTHVVAPIRDRVAAFARVRHPRIASVLRFVFKKQIAQAKTKYFSGTRTGANFAIYKTYRLLLYQTARA